MKEDAARADRLHRYLFTVFARSVATTRAMIPKKRPPRIQIESVWPQLDCGRYPIKRSVGQPVTVWATIFRDGHEQLRAAVRYRPGSGRWREVPLEHVEA